MRLITNNDNLEEYTQQREDLIVYVMKNFEDYVA